MRKLSLIKSFFVLYAFLLMTVEVRSQSSNPLPDIKIYTTDGEAISIQSLTDSIPTFFYFWATWCNACSKDMPKILKLEKEFTNKVRFVRIAWKDKPQTLKKYFLKRSYRLSSYIDRDGRLFHALQIKQTPTVVITDGNGEIKFNGYGSQRKLKKLLRKVSAK